MGMSYGGEGARDVNGKAAGKSSSTSSSTAGTSSSKDRASLAPATSSRPKDRPSTLSFGKYGRVDAISPKSNFGIAQTGRPRFAPAKGPGLLNALTGFGFYDSKTGDYISASEDMIDGGGRGTSDPDAFGGPFGAVSNDLGATPYGSGRAPTGLAGFVANGGVLGALIDSLGKNGPNTNTVRGPDGEPYRGGKGDGGDTLIKTPTKPTVSTMTDNAKTATGPIPNPNYNPADPMSSRYLMNPSYDEIIAYQNKLAQGVQTAAKGGIMSLVEAEGGNEKTLISDAIAAIENGTEDEAAAVALARFVQVHGGPALRDLVEKVQSGDYADTRERFANGENGIVKGPGDGSGTDDKVPATIEGQQDVLLADGEMVLRKKTTDALEAVLGKGGLDAVNAAEDDAPTVLQRLMNKMQAERQTA
jgi:hypothetical protein